MCTIEATGRIRVNAALSCLNAPQWVRLVLWKHTLPCMPRLHHDPNTAHKAIPTANPTAFLVPQKDLLRKMEEVHPRAASLLRGSGYPDGAFFVVKPSEASVVGEVDYVDLPESEAPSLSP